MSDGVFMLYFESIVVFCYVYLKSFLYCVCYFVLFLRIFYGIYMHLLWDCTWIYPPDFGFLTSYDPQPDP
jgi:hypothetical protein